MGRVDGKVALITGAASGLGRADATILAREGATVVLTDINEEAGEATAESIREAGGNATFFALDVADEGQWQQVIDRVRSEYGRLDILVNNAGLVIMESLEECSLETFRKQNAVMSEGVFLGCKHALPLMNESGGGSIINMSSIASHLGYPIFFAYSAAKGAVRAMSKAIAIHCQMNDYKVRVNSLHPGAIDTPMIDQTASELGLDNKEDLSPVGLGQPEDVANVVLFLASDESRFVNGTEILIDNALSIQ
jgi:3(or 17)beta-hydroxysteroid dehydrogenase